MRATLLVLALVLGMVLVVGVAGLADDGGVAWPGIEPRPQYVEFPPSCLIIVRPDGSWCLLCYESVCIRTRLDRLCHAVCYYLCKKQSASDAKLFVTTVA